MNGKPIIALFEENELNIASLYSLYAQILPANNVFWNRLSNEEIKHASQIGNQKELSESIVESKFLRNVVSYIMNFVLKEITKTKKSTITHEDALKTALRIEHSMLERKCFDLFELKNSTLIELFNKMNRDTERHVQILLKEIKKHKFSLEE